MQERIKRKNNKKARQKKKRQFIMGLIGVLVIVCGCMAYLYHYVNKYEKDKACDNIYIGTIDVSGKSESEIVKLLEKQVEMAASSIVKMEVGEKKAEVTLKELGLSMSNAKAVAKEAVEYGKEGSLWSRYTQVRKLKKEAYVLKESFAIDTEIAASVMEKQTESLENGAKDATITRSGGSFVVTEGIPGNTVNVEKSLSALMEQLNKDWNYKEIDLELVQEMSDPKVKKEDLESIQDLMGSFWTVAGGGSRLKNLERAAELLDGKVVMPGEEVSVIAETRPYTLENGYVEGSAYANGKIVTNIGGGLCQVSTTLYNALLYAELEIVERSAHSMEVHYVDLSRDAAIAEGVKDLRFKNNYETPIYIEGYIDGNNRLTFNIYGKETRASNREVEYESEVLETTKYATNYVADSGSAIGYISDEDGTAMNGGRAKLWKIVYEDGKEVSREQVNSSSYRATTVTVKIGTKSKYTDATKMVNSAISSQNISTIKSAISEANQLISEEEQKKAEEEKKKAEEEKKKAEEEAAAKEEQEKADAEHSGNSNTEKSDETKTENVNTAEE